MLFWYSSTIDKGSVPADAESLETQSRITHYSASDFHFAKITVYSVENDDKKRQEMKQGDELGR